MGLVREEKKNYKNLKIFVAYLPMKYVFICIWKTLPVTGKDDQKWQEIK